MARIIAERAVVTASREDFLSAAETQPDAFLDHRRPACLLAFSALGPPGTTMDQFGGTAGSLVDLHVRDNVNRNADGRSRVHVHRGWYGQSVRVGMGDGYGIRRKVADPSAGDLAYLESVIPVAAASVDRLEQILDDRSASTGKSRDAVAATMLSTVPVGRFAEAGEIAAAIAFLASPAAAYINGVSLAVDGGRMQSI